MFGSIPLKTPQELLMIREAGRIVGSVLERLRQLAAPGVTTLDLDAEAEALISGRGARPAFKGYRGPGKSPFPGTVCASVNDAVVHGIPDRRKLREGDVLSLDVGVQYEGFFGDAAVTLPIGEMSERAEALVRVCSEALDKAIVEMRPGNALSKIGEAVQAHVESSGFSVVREFVGHGIGTDMHEAPEVPNFVSDRSEGVVMEPGLVLAVEPMINAGGCEVRHHPRRWPVTTADGQLSAHFEHTVAVTPDGPEILTLP